MRRLPLLACAVALLAATSVVAAEKPVEVGHAMPEFSLPGLEGEQISFSRSIRGKAPLTIFLFMTTACSACYEELKEIHDFVGKNPGKIDAWAVAVDLRGAQTVGPYQKANGFRVKYLIDPKFSLPRTFGFNYTPSLAIVDARGVLLHKKGGYAPNERVHDLIKTFLK
ncbi:MAG: TlpA family protein disulfide reductase [Deltaproteobacteria bacterium]|nr:MAG: TlpA family protein disulfide reductase [Deltaproteobacteria bacterium]